MLFAEKYREKAIQSLLYKLENCIKHCSSNGGFQYVWIIPLDVPNLVVLDVKKILEEHGFDVDKPTADNLVISWV